MVGSAALIERGAVQPGQVEQVVTHARRIQRAGARMNRLIGDLVDVASIKAGLLAVNREVGDPTTVVTEAWARSRCRQQRPDSPSLRKSYRRCHSPRSMRRGVFRCLPTF